MDTVKIRRPWSVTKRKFLFVSCSVLRPQKEVSDQPPGQCELVQRALLEDVVTTPFAGGTLVCHS
jgi:hypothetical protein